MASPKRNIGVAGLIVLSMIFAGIGGGLVGGVAGYRLALDREPAVTAAGPTPTTGPATPTENVAEPAIERTSDAVVDTVAKTSPAVVKVVSSLGAGQKSSGSGVIISEDGYVITNNHVVEGQRRLQVIYADGSYHDAELTGTDPFADIAVIRVRDAVPAVAELGDSDALQPGETVIAIGSPLGEFQNSVTVGVVSALNRSVDRMEGLIQTDAAINHGNSGGPLIDTNGKVIGINTLVVRGGQSSLDVAQGLGFAVPSNIVRDVTDALISNGQVARPFLGVTYELLTPEAEQAGVGVDHGAIIVSVGEEGPARRAGLLPGDVITAVNGEQITAQISLQRILMNYKPNDTVTLTVMRDGASQEVQLTLAERPPEDQINK
ncbi:MAG TPA: trypsin-like peptidase domain-containing protein [Herpetosiphonaceae bacterium]|nr:trypsin-like peptidase domain-containing protein [Herpetosiphonaceae bacterium]